MFQINEFEEKMFVDKLQITHLEDLSNEIFFDLFEYLNGYEIMKIFSNLNYRFQQLIYSTTILDKTQFYLYDLKEILNKNVQLSSLIRDSNLQILSVHYSSDLKFVNAHQWQNFIMNSYPRLEKFYLKYSHSKKRSEYDQLYSQLNGFSSSFWIERKWCFEIIIDRESVDFHVHPSGKSANFHQHSSLTFKNFDRIDVHIIRDDMEAISSHIRIHHLNFQIKYTLFILLLHAQELFHDCSTLNIYSLQQDEFTWHILTLPGCQYFSPSGNSQITSVIFQEFHSIEHLQSLFFYWKFLKYFQIGKLINISIESFIDKIIFLRTRGWGTKCTICILTFNDEMIQDIDYLIHFKNQSLPFTIKRLHKQIQISC